MCVSLFSVIDTGSTLAGSRARHHVTLSLWAFSRQGATGVPLPYSQHGTRWQARGEPQYLETFRARTQAQHSVGRYDQGILGDPVGPKAFTQLFRVLSALL